jgi:hypothetical protein
MAASASWEEMSGNAKKVSRGVTKEGVAKEEAIKVGKLEMNLNFASQSSSGSSSSGSGGVGAGEKMKQKRNSLKKFQSCGDFNDLDAEGGTSSSSSSHPTTGYIHRATSDVSNVKSSSSSSCSSNSSLVPLSDGKGAAQAVSAGSSFPSESDYLDYHDNICGWLKKRNSRSMFGISTWRTRWFELNNRTRVLKYYLREREVVVSGGGSNPNPHATIDMTKYLVKDLGDMLWELVPPTYSDSGEMQKRERINKKNSKTSDSRVWRFKGKVFVFLSF